MKYVVCVPDGCADEPVEALGGRTPLEAADTPTLDTLAASGEVGLARVIPQGMPPGSDVGNMSILGYDPARYHTGRAPIEAAAIGLRLADDRVAYRCNLVTIGPDGTMADFAGGHPDSSVAASVIEALEAELGGGGLEFHAGVQYRHIVIAPVEWADAVCTPPHDLTGRPAEWPEGPAADRLRDVMEASIEVVGRFDIEATQVWLWGQGSQPDLPPFAETRGVGAGLVTAVDLVRGLGVLTGIEVHELATATGWYDTDYEGKRDLALEALSEGLDLFVVHVEASDEAGHAGNVEEKVRSLENWDRRILDGLVEGLGALGEWRLLLLPDHATPLATRTHTAEPVPYLLVGSDGDEGGGGAYTERAVAGCAPVAGHELIDRLLAV